MDKNTLLGVLVAVMLLGAGFTIGRVYSVSLSEPIRVLAEKADKSEKCTTIKDGGLKTLDGDDISTGFNDRGYNYQAKIFDGKYCDVYSEDEYCDENEDVDLVMKWNDAFLGTKDCDGDTLLDQFSGHEGYIGSGAWLTHHMSGTYENEEGKSCNWNAFRKIVAAPEDADSDDGRWYDSDGDEIGKIYWRWFAITEEKINDPCGDGEKNHEVFYESEVPKGLGIYKN